MKSTILLHGTRTCIPAHQRLQYTRLVSEEQPAFFLRLLIIQTIHTLQLDSAYRCTSQGEFCHANSYLHSNNPARQQYTYHHTSIPMEASKNLSKKDTSTSMHVQHRLLQTDTFQVQHKSTKNTGAAQALVALTQQKLNIKKNVTGCFKFAECALKFVKLTLSVQGVM